MVQWLRLALSVLPLWGARARSLVGALRPYMMHDVAKNKIKDLIVPFKKY